MKKEKSLNETVAKFKHNKQHFEIDWLTDANRGRTRTYDLFGIEGTKHYHLHQFESNSYDKTTLVKMAKEAIESYQISF